MCCLQFEVCDHAFIINYETMQNLIIGEINNKTILLTQIYFYIRTILNLKSNMHIPATTSNNESISYEYKTRMDN